MYIKISIASLLGAIISLCSFGQINSSTFGAMEARILGPGTMSGRITSIQGVNSEPKTIYVGTAGGGIWKTTNAGASFKSIFDKYTQSIGDIAVDQNNPKVVFAGTGESNMRNTVSYGDGLYKTTDAGENWKKIGLDSTEHIAKIAIHPKNGDIVYVAAPGPLYKDSPHRGLYKTEDGGKTWTNILYTSPKTGVADVSIDPANPDVIYATKWEFRRTPYSFSSGGKEGGIFKSIDGGKNWKRIQKGMPEGMIGRVALTLAPSAPENLVAIAELENNKTGLYISSDGGENWKAQSATSNVISRPFYFSTLVVDPKNPKRVYRPAYSFSYSNDGGYSFAEASSEGTAVHADHHALWINPNSTNEMWLGTDGGVYLSLDQGVSWSFKHNLPVGQFYHVAVDNAAPYRMYGGLQDNGSWIAPSAAPGGVGNSVWQDIFGGDGFWVVPDLKNPAICYAESQGGNVGRVDIQTGKSVNIQPVQSADEDKLRWNWNSPIHVGPKSKALYVAAQYLYKSVDEGRNWQRISPDLTTNNKAKQNQEESGGLSADNTSAENHCTIFTIAESSLDANLIWAGTDDGNLQYTIDGGKTWTNVSSNITVTGIPEQTWVSSIAPGKFDKQVVYATFDNHMYGDYNTYVAKSDDLGKTWTLLKGGEEMDGHAHKILEDAENPDLLFLGAEKGLYTTIDGGKSWFRMKNNVPWYALVRDLAIQPETNDLVIATHGRGIIVMDDISAIRNMTSKTANSDVFLFPMKPVKMVSAPFGGSGFPTAGGWNGGNPPVVPAIRYYLKNRVMSGDVKVDVIDMEGKILQTIVGSKRKGINLVYWNQRTMPPKTPSGSVQMDISAFAAPIVLPGTYTLKLTVGKDTFTQPYTVEHDPKGVMSLADRKEQNKVSMQLFGMNEQTTSLLDSLLNIQKMLEGKLATESSKKMKKMAGEYHEKVGTMRGKLIVLKSKGQFADQQRFKDELSGLYTSIVYNEQAPSNTQMQKLSLLKDRLSGFENEWKTLYNQYHSKIF